MEQAPWRLQSPCSRLAKLEATAGLAPSAMERLDAIRLDLDELAASVGPSELSPVRPFWLALVASATISLLAFVLIGVAAVWLSVRAPPES